LVALILQQRIPDQQICNTFEKRKKESERSSSGSLTYPVHTRLILASNGPKTLKRGGECSMPGKGI
jgi:hypothetical protein